MYYDYHKIYKKRKRYKLRLTVITLGVIALGIFFYKNYAHAGTTGTYYNPIQTTNITYSPSSYFSISQTDIIPLTNNEIIIGATINIKRTGTLNSGNIVINLDEKIDGALFQNCNSGYSYTSKANSTISYTELNELPLNSNIWRTIIFNTPVTLSTSNCYQLRADPQNLDPREKTSIGVNENNYTNGYAIGYSSFPNYDISGWLITQDATNLPKPIIYSPSENETIHNKSITITGNGRLNNELPNGYQFSNYICAIIIPEEQNAQAKHLCTGRNNETGLFNIATGDLHNDRYLINVYTDVYDSNNVFVERVWSGGRVFFINVTGNEFSVINENNLIDLNNSVSQFINPIMDLKNKIFSKAPLSWLTEGVNLVHDLFFATPTGNKIFDINITLPVNPKFGTTSLSFETNAETWLKEGSTWTTVNNWASYLLWLSFLYWAIRRALTLFANTL